MKNTAKAVIAMVALGASAWILIAQDAGNPPDDQRPPRRQNADGQDGPGGPGGPGGPRMRAGRPPIPPVIRALDANHDGVIDADEIANAPAALKSLDKNGDGKLTLDELMPPPPPGRGGYPGDGQGPGNGPQSRRPRPDAGGNFDGPPGPPPGDQQ